MAFDFHAAYDQLNPADDDYRFYARLADSVAAARVVDLGCGTGVLARLLAASGRDVVAVDPDPEMLRVARERDSAGLVEWRLGDSGDLAGERADLAVMSGHVAQVFTEDDAWRAALADLRGALRVDGLLSFESRNPGARAWEGWTRDLTLRVVASPEGEVEFWHETVEVALPLVSYDTFTRDRATGATVSNRDTLAFRNESALRASLTAAGFSVVDVVGSWDGSPVTAASPELIVTARRR